MKMKLGDLATYINGYPFKPQDRGKTGLPIIRIQDLSGNSYDLGFYDGTYPEKIEINNGDVLISWSASLGIYIWNRGKALLNQHIFKVVFDKKTISKDYFVYAVRYALNSMVSKTHGATMKHIIKQDFDETEIPYPSLEEQKHIANILLQVERIIKLRTKQLSALDDLSKSRFVEMFGDETVPQMFPVVKLAEIAEKISDGVHAKPEYTSTGKPFLSVVNIVKGFVDFSDCKFVSEDAYQKMIQSTHPQRGDVLYTKVGATYGVPAYVDSDRDFCLYVSVCLIKPNNSKVNSRFLAFSMKMPYVKRQADARIKGIGVPDLHLNQIRDFDIILPSFEKQNEFVTFIEKLDKTKSSIQKSIDETQLLFDSLMQKYFG